MKRRAKLKEWFMMKMGIVSPSLLCSSPRYNQRLARVNPERYNQLVRDRINFDVELEKKLQEFGND